MAKATEQKRRRELEEGFNNLEDVRQDRVRTVREIADEYLASYQLRNPRSATFAEYAVGHVKRFPGDKMLVDVNEETVKEYQDARLREKTAPKSINEEVGFLLRVMGGPGDICAFACESRRSSSSRLEAASARRTGLTRRRA